MVKVYALESGSGAMRRILKGSQGPASWANIYVSAIALPEAVAAVERKRREGDLDADAASRLADRIRRDLTGSTRRYGVVEVARPITINASRLAQDHGLRGYDSVQLATALAVATALPAGAIFQMACADGDLCDAARAVGLQVLIPGG